jgi:TatA/E family protein of Tat protein translocase
MAGPADRAGIDPPAPRFRTEAISMLHLAAIGTTEWILIIGALALLFGARKIPELARSLGSCVNEFKKGR